MFTGVCIFVDKIYFITQVLQHYGKHEQLLFAIAPYDHVDA